MATKPISTCVSDTFVFVCRLCVFILFGNPLSMFFYHLLFPDEAVEFARNRNIFGTKIYAFYERLALKWPFYWAKWWMQLENLSDYTVERQIKYLFKVAFRNETEVEALKAMGKNCCNIKDYWSKAYEELFFKHGRKVLPLKRRDLENRDGVPKWYLHYVAEFMMQNVRLSYFALRDVIYWAKQNEQIRRSLMKYLACGKLSDAQFKMLIVAVKEEDTDEVNWPILEVMLDYVKRYGISEEHLAQVKSEYPRQFAEMVAHTAVQYVQYKAVKAFSDTDEGRSAWRVFCKETPEILPETQALMSHRQYAIFHNVGRKLDVEAIKAFLCRSDRALWKAVFIKEKDTCQTEEVRSFIGSNADWELVYRDTQNENEHNATE